MALVLSGTALVAFTPTASACQYNPEPAPYGGLVGTAWNTTQGSLELAINTACGHHPLPIPGLVKALVNEACQILIGQDCI